MRGNHRCVQIWPFASGDGEARSPYHKLESYAPCSNGTITEPLSAVARLRSFSWPVQTCDLVHTGDMRRHISCSWSLGVTTVALGPFSSD